QPRGLAIGLAGPVRIARRLAVRAHLDAVDLMAQGEVAARDAGLHREQVVVGRHCLRVVVGAKAEVELGVRALADAALAPGVEHRRAVELQPDHVTSSSSPATGSRCAYSKCARPSDSSVSRSIHGEPPRRDLSEALTRMLEASLSYPEASLPSGS